MRTLETLAICCAALERLDEARAFVEQMRQLEKPPDTFALMKARRLVRRRDHVDAAQSQAAGVISMAARAEAIE